MLSNLKIQGKMLLGFGIVILMTMILSAISVISLKTIDNTYTNLMDNTKMQYQHIMNVSLQYENARRTLLRASLFSYSANAEGVAAAYDMMLEHIDALYGDIELYKESVNSDPALSDEEKSQRNGLADEIIVDIQTEYMEIADTIYENAIVGNSRKVYNTINSTMDFAARIESNVSQLKNYALTTLDEGSDSASRLVDFIFIMILALSLLIIVLSITISIFISNAIKKPLHELGVKTKEIANGNLDVQIGSNYRDEIGQLTNDIGQVAGVIRELVYRIDNLSQELEAGNIDATIETAAFKGYYKKAALGISAATTNLIQDLKNIADCMQSYAQGDFEAQIKPYPGKKAIINETMNLVQSNLKAVNQDIIDLIHGATDGKLDVKVDTTRYLGGWKEIVEGLNELLTAIETPMEEVHFVLSEVSKANLSVRVTGSYKGAFNRMKEDLNTTIENTSAYITDISEILIRMSSQDLDIQINKDYIGDFAQIKEALRLILKQFNLLIGEINLSAAQVSAGATQVSHSSMSLAEGATMQASAIEEISNTISLITDQANENIKNTDKVKELATITKTNSVSSQAQMDRMMEAMEGIHKASEGISQIIKVIDDIAFQTNLLALNASVEAARAGEHGKGFTVVAEEVRNLATRSRKAAQETSKMIQDSIQKVNEGTKIAHSTSSSLKIIVDQIDAIFSLINKVAQSFEEQHIAVKQADGGIGQIADVTHANTATSEESASSAQELASQAELFKNTVAKFKLAQTHS